LGLIEAVPGVFCGQAVRQNRWLQAARARQRNRFSESSGGIGRKWTNMADRHVLEEAKTVRQEEV
jgi:hypothetical protein